MSYSNYFFLLPPFPFPSLTQQWKGKFIVKASGKSTGSKSSSETVVSNMSKRVSQTVDNVKNLASKARSSKSIDISDIAISRGGSVGNEIAYNPKARNMSFAGGPNVELAENPIFKGVGKEDIKL